MRSAQQTIDQTFPEMRWRALSLAADLDRIECGEDGARVLRADPRIDKLRRALQAMLEGAGRTERVQMIFSDTTPPPARNPK